MRRALAIAAVVIAALALPSVASAIGSGEVRGTVTPTSIAPEVEVCLVEARPSENCASPEANGNYALTGLPLGTTRIEFIPSYRSRYAVQYYDHVHSLNEAAAISLSSASPKREGINADLELGGAIEGTVTAAVGKGALAGIEVCALTAATRVAAGCVDTDEAGNYRLGGLSPGSYKVGFWGHGQSAEYAPQYYDGKTTLGLATAISVPAGSIQTGIDGEMVKGARITGIVTAAAGGGGIAGVPVCLFAAGAATPARCVFTEPSGAYALLGVAAGSYQVGFSLSTAEIGGEASSSGDDGYLTQYYAGVGTRGEALTLMLAGEQVASGIDAGLLVPAAPPAIIPPAAVAAPTIAAPPIVTAPSKPAAKKCKSGFVKKKVKGVVKCVKKAPQSHKKKTHKKKAPKKKTSKKTNPSIKNRKHQ